MGWESLVGRPEALLVQSRGAELVPLFASRPWMVGGSPQQPPLVGMDVELSPTPRTLGLSFLGLTLVCKVPWEHGWKGSLDSHPLPSQESPPPGRPPHW